MAHILRGCCLVLAARKCTPTLLRAWMYTYEQPQSHALEYTYKHSVPGAGVG